MRRRFDEIVEFSALANFIDMPLRTYSTGMVARLAFAVATTVDADIYLLDEVLSVGDESFGMRCAERIERFRLEGGTILLVSHSLPTVERLCREALWLHEGRVMARGPASEVVGMYQAGVSSPSFASRFGEVAAVGPRILLVPGAAGAGPIADAAPDGGLTAQLAALGQADRVRVLAPARSEGRATPAAAGGPDQDVDDAVAWADLVLIHGGAGLGGPAVRAAVGAAQTAKALVVCRYVTAGPVGAAARWVLERADAVLVPDDAGAERLHALVPRARAAVAAPGEEAGRAIAAWGSSLTNGGRVDSPDVGPTAASGVPGAPGAALEQRVRDLERSLESALGELARVHGSRLWRLGASYWKVRPAMVRAWRRVTHPVEAIRVAAPPLLPVRLRSRLVRALRAGRRNPPAPAPDPSRVDALLDRLASAPDRYPTLLVLPIIEWGFRHQRPQQLAAALAARGWPVLYASCTFDVDAHAVSISQEPGVEGSGASACRALAGSTSTGTRSTRAAWRE